MKRITTFAMSNEMRLTADVSAITIPFGRWPYGRQTVEMPDGTTRAVFVMQTFNSAGAAKIAEAIRAEVAAGGKGLPLYFGHPDAPEVAHKFPDKRAKGWAREAIVNDQGLTLPGIAWAESPQNGFGWYSPYWEGVPAFTDPQNAEVTVDTLFSIGLTNNPNILEFRLANEAGYDTTQPSGLAADRDNTMNREQIIAALGLPPEATDEQIIAEITRIKVAADEVATKVEAANAETVKAKEEEEKAKTDLANERQARAGLLLDSAIAEKRISVAGRAAWAKRLAGNFDSGALALANEKPLKTETVTGSLPRTAGTIAPDIGALANEKVKQGLTFEAAWAALKKERPELFTAAAK